MSPDLGLLLFSDQTVLPRCFFRVVFAYAMQNYKKEMNTAYFLLDNC